MLLSSFRVDVFIHRKLLADVWERNGRDHPWMMDLHYSQQSGDVTGTAAVLHVPIANPQQQPGRNVGFC